MIDLSRLWGRYRAVLSAPLFGLAIGTVLALTTGLPFWAILSIVAALFLVPVVAIGSEEYKQRRDRLALMSGVLRTYSHTGHLEENRDFTTLSKYRFEKRDGGPLQYIDKSTIRSFADSIEYKPPVVLSSKPAGIEVEERYKVEYRDEVNLGGNTDSYLCLDFAYKLSKPLVARGDFIEYEVASTLRGGGATAFTEDGQELGTFVATLTDRITMSWIVPPRFRVLLGNARVLDSSGNLNQTLTDSLKDAVPTLRSNDSEVYWELVYPVVRHYYMVQMRVVER